MQEGFQRRKHQEWIHIQQQCKNYKKNFQGRPLIPKQISTYLEMTSFITQLIPAFNQHYFQILTPEENSFTNQAILSIATDMQAKLKSLAYRIQKKEIEENNSKDVKTLCKVCLHELRAAEIAEARQNLEGKDALTLNILKIIKEVEQTSQPFSLEQDRRFFKELKAALKKKEEVIQLCQSEGNQFINMIEEQLKGILLNKELLIFPEDRSNQQPEIKGYELKENVTKSLKTHINEKIPEIIKLVASNLKKAEQKQRKLRTIHAETQTIDTESTKIVDLKRKIAALQLQLSQLDTQKTKINWTLQQKILTIQKFEKELNNLKEQSNRKIYDLQKETRTLEDKNRKYKEQLQKQKSRRYLEFPDSNLKSMNSFAQLKDPSFAEELPNEQQHEQQRRDKRKKTVNSFAKTNGKFFLPTIKKISNDDETLLQEDSRNYETEQPTILQQRNDADNHHNSSNVALISSSKASISKKNSLSNMASKQTSRSRKKTERLMTIANTKDSINEGEMNKRSSYKTVKTERATEAMYEESTKDMSIIKTTKEKTANLQKKSGNQIKRLNNQTKHRKDKIINNHFRQNESNTEEKVIQRKQMRKEAHEVNEKLKEMIPERLSVHSPLSNKGSYNSINKTAKESIYKRKNRTEEQSQINQSPSKNDLSQFAPMKRQTAKEKHYLRNSFSKINEQIDKQNYQTPVFESQSVGMENLKKLQQNKTMKHHLFQIYREISKQSKNHRDINIDKFSQIFQKYVQGLKDAKDKEQAKQANDDNVITAITEPFLPRLNQSLINATIHLKQTDAYCGVNRLKKYHQKQQLQLLKSRLEDQLGKGRAKQNSMNASYHLSPTMTEELYQSKMRKQLSLSKVKNGTLLTLENLLFFNQEIAYSYETNFKKKAKTVPITPQIEEYLNSLFASFEQIKKKNASYYHQISGFLRYPFSHSQNGFLQIDILKNMSLATLTHCFLQILPYHKKCQIDKGVCGHLLRFKDKAEQYAQKTDE